METLIWVYVSGGPDIEASDSDWQPSIKAKKLDEPTPTEKPNEPSTSDAECSVYDSDEDGNTKEVHRTLNSDKVPWNPQEVRKCVRSEFAHPGSSWKSPRFQALPPAKAAESRLAGTAAQQRFTNVYFVRVVQNTANVKKVHPQRLSQYLAAEITAQLTTCAGYDRFWAASHDLEEYIRQAIWPQIMHIDAVQHTQGLGSDVVTLAKAIPPPTAAGFNNDRFWGYSVYMALRFPPGSHPFTTPVVRNTIAYFRRCIIDGRDPWGSDYANIDTQMALAASWAGYNIAHLLINHNAYDLTPEEMQVQRRQLDTLVWLVSGAHGLVGELFRGVITARGNVDTAATTSHLQEEMHRMQWDRFVGNCHRVAYNWENSLPLPLCKPSRIFEEMKASGAIEDWDNSAPFSTEFDEPLDPSVHKMKGSGLVLSKIVSEKVSRVNKWLLDFLRGEHSLQVTKDRFSYMPEYLSHGLDDHEYLQEVRDLGRQDIRAASEAREPLQEAAPNIDSPLQHEISELKASIVNIEKIVKEVQTAVTGHTTAIDGIRHDLAQQNPDNLARLLAPALLKTLEPALIKSLERAQQKVLKDSMKRHASETIKQVQKLMGPLHEKLDKIEAKTLADRQPSRLPPLGRGEIATRRTQGATTTVEAEDRSAGRSRMQRDEDDGPLANFEPPNVNRTKLLSTGFVGNPMAEARSSIGSSTAGTKRASENASPQATKRPYQPSAERSSQTTSQGWMGGPP
ncbi:hypothetical protein F5X68DRAFT_266250 [Plectosphaerella plurivora]|uniref:Uncharacterized protein n=1 Tax=Plectosphaerella plurivora TaxID=936078 RepID=A0A9P8V071_9PEZI|nr:hypothetical protein F5X68DRAFT_266250 [Plectosphaerella plurivora]